MQSAPTSAQEDTARPDIEANAQSFRRHLRAANRQPATVHSYLDAVSRLDAFLAARGMPRSVAAIRREHVEAFVEDQLTRLKPASAANRYRSLQQFFRWLVDEGEVRESPMARMRPPTIPETPPPVIPEDHVRRLLAVTKGPAPEERRDRAIIMLLFDTGVRLSEIAGLLVADVEFDVRVGRDQDIAGVIHVTGKGNRRRVAPFGKETAKDLDRYFRASRANPESEPDRWLWLGRKGRLTSTGIAQMLRRRAREAGIGDIHPHLFRHTFAHLFLSRRRQRGRSHAPGWLAISGRC
jgi:site-specific recombinase XerD